LDINVDPNVEVPPTNNPPFDIIRLPLDINVDPNVEVPYTDNLPEDTKSNVYKFVVYVSP
jgi:hypothetical protein